MTLTDRELEAMLAGLESDTVEREASLQSDGPTRVREAICAFANDLAGRGRAGVVFIGAADDGGPTGLDISDNLILQLAHMKTDGNILPPPTMTVEKRTLSGAAMAVVRVWPADAPPVGFHGRIWIRVGSRRGTATAQDERVLNEKRRHRDRPFDVHPVSTAQLADLDRRRFEEEYLPAAVAPDVLAANERTYEQRLAAAKMVSSVDDPTPTVLAVLVLSPRPRDFLPGAYVQFLRIAGRDLGDPIVDELVVDGPIAAMLRRLDDKLVAHNRTAVDLTTSDRERRTHAYPKAALEQIIRNPILHRSYEGTNAPVRVTWFDDRIEVHSPGGPFGVVTVENFGRPGVSDYRNPSLAEALKILGLVQQFGVGIATARKELAANGNPPLEFGVDSAHVAVTLRPAT